MMTNEFSKELPGLELILGVGFVGFMLSICWGKLTKMKMDGDTIRFLAVMWSGIAVFGTILMFVM